ncbi:hypothetical protein H310_06734 [Aphanomyces invadans]|uniref:Uncharacterized protein n=1 Tax=Aphanomyces invadans TaxID=157072 RepID=A0A024U5E5_9STRA|nr:hypothetical protein H310_06734 [Aphanomyces invadans]ETW01122.1 hypothetical protein H310_06734 [Aphanomyces invadans]|eukprot:XP_008870120.1 hypothetical protein H310_06734 [Aphanomyces invadans]
MDFAEESPPPPPLGTVETMITHFFSGTVAGFTGAIVGYPLDTIKSRMQTQMHLPASSTSTRITPLQAFLHSIRQEGILSLYSGASTQVARQAIGCSILFGLLSQFKGLFYTPSDGPGSPEAHPRTVLAASAACTGVVEASIYCPFEITMIRMQTQAMQQNTWQCAARIYMDHGLRNGLYRGFFPTCSREMLGNLVYFLSYERFKDMLKTHTSMTDMQVYGVAGAAAGPVYWCTIFPLDTIKAVVQADAMDLRHRKHHGIRDCATHLYREGGISRFFRGLSPCLIRTMPVSAVKFMAFEKSVQVMTPWWPSQRAAATT